MELKQAILERRSIRKYQDRDVPKEVLERVISTALWAPSGMNRQTWEVVVLRGESRDRLMEIISRSQEHMLPRLRELFSDKMINITLQVFKNLGGAPAVVLVYVPREKIDYKLYAETDDIRGRYHLEFKRFNHFLNASALIQNLLLAAHDEGLGTCWMTGPRYMEQEINELVGMTDKELVSIIPIGYPDQSPPAPPRKENAVRWLGF